MQRPAESRPLKSFATSRSYSRVPLRPGSDAPELASIGIPHGWVMASPGEGTHPKWVSALAPGGGKSLESFPSRGDAEFSQQALHVRTNGVLGDEEPLRDLVGGKVVVEEQKHLELPRRERGCDRVG